jgi:hypothetical protein
MGASNEKNSLMPAGMGGIFAFAHSGLSKTGDGDDTAGSPAKDTIP